MAAQLPPALDDQAAVQGVAKRDAAAQKAPVEFPAGDDPEELAKWFSGLSPQQQAGIIRSVPQDQLVAIYTAEGEYGPKGTQGIGPNPLGNIPKTAAPNEQFTPSDPALQREANKDATKAKADKQATPAGTTTPESPYVALANGLAQMYNQQVQGLQPLISGSALFGGGAGENQLLQGAQALLSGGPAAGQQAWLAQQTADENQQSAPLQAAMQQEGKATNAAESLYSGAAGALGPAFAAYLQGAPYQSLLQQLVSTIPYEIAKSGNYNLPQMPGSPGLHTALGILTGSAGLPNLSLPGAQTAAAGAQQTQTVPTAGSTTSPTA